MSSLMQLEMTLDEARETDRLIKRHINTTRYLLLDMRDRKGWKALGYENFVEYGEKELGFASTHLYRLADSAEISLQIGFSPLGEKSPPETHLRPLKSVPEEDRKAIWEEATRKAEEEGAKLTAKRIEEEVSEWKRRAQESQAESNERRKKIRELEQQLELAERAEPEVKVVEKIIEKPMIPQEFSSLEDAIAAKRKDLENLDRNTQDAIQKNRAVYESRERLQREVEELTTLLSKHKASEREQVEHKRLTDSALQFTALFLAEIQALEYAPNAEQYRRWKQVSAQFRDSILVVEETINRLSDNPISGELMDRVQ